MPGNYQELAEIFKNMSPQMTGACMAMFISVLRVVYDDQETSPVRIFLEALICGALSLTTSSAILAAGLDMNWAIFAGGSIGYFGSASVRALAYKFINHKLGE